MSDHPSDRIPSRPICGWISVLMLVVAVPVGFVSFYVIADTGEFAGFAAMLIGLVTVIVLGIGGFVLGILGIARRERPWWPAAVGTAIGFIPFITMIWFLISGLRMRDA